MEILLQPLQWNGSSRRLASVCLRLLLHMTKTVVVSLQRRGWNHVWLHYGACLIWCTVHAESWENSHTHPLQRAMVKGFTGCGVIHSICIRCCFTVCQLWFLSYFFFSSMKTRCEILCQYNVVLYWHSTTDVVSCRLAYKATWHHCLPTLKKNIYIW